MQRTADMQSGAGFADHRPVNPVAFSPPRWLRLLAVVVAGGLATISVHTPGSSWIFPLCLALWVVLDFPRTTFVDEAGIWRRGPLGLGVERVAWQGAWVEHERPEAGRIPGEVRIYSADGQWLRFSGSWEENARFIQELSRRGVPSR